MTKKASLYFDSFLMFYKNTLFDEGSIENLQLCVKKIQLQDVVTGTRRAGFKNSEVQGCRF